MSVGVHLDTSIGMLEETRFKNKYSDLIKRLSKEVHFTYNEVESILLIYYKFTKEENHALMTKTQFKTILHCGLDMTDAELSDIVASNLDKSPTNIFSMESWVRAMSLFLRGTLDEKIEHCYKVYNMMGTKKITRDQMLHLLRHATIGEEDPEDAVKDLIEIVTKKMDVDRDGKISFNDYKETVLNQPLLLEAFGQCLPSRLAVHSFLTTFTHRYGKL